MSPPQDNSKQIKLQPKKVLPTLTKTQKVTANEYLNNGADVAVKATKFAGATVKDYAPKVIDSIVSFASG